MGEELRFLGFCGAPRHGSVLSSCSPLLAVPLLSSPPLLYSHCSATSAIRNWKKAFRVEIGAEEIMQP